MTTILITTDVNKPRNRRQDSNKALRFEFDNKAEAALLKADELHLKCTDVLRLIELDKRMKDLLDEVAIILSNC